MAELPEIVRQRLARQTGGEHPDADLLNAFAEGALTERERGQVLAHLSACGACREVVSLALPQTPAPQPAPAPAKPGWLSWPVLRWSAVTAAVVIVGAAVMLRETRRAAPFRAGESAVGVSKQDEAAKVPAPELRESKENAAAATNESIGAKKKVSTPPPVDRRDKEVPAAESRKDEQLAAVRKSAPAVKAAGAAQQDRGLDELQQQRAQVGIPQQNAPAGQQAYQAGAAGGVVQRQGQLSMTQQAVPTSSAVPAAPAQVRAEQNVVAADRAQATPEMPAAGAMEVTAAKGRAKMAPLMRASLAARWRVSSEGKLERSLDGGATWHAIPVQGGGNFRAVSAVGGDVWVGGIAGALYHSADGGQTWARVGFLKADITRIEFTDTLQGIVTTASGETWVTADGGRTWNARTP